MEAYAREYHQWEKLKAAHIAFEAPSEHRFEVEVSGDPDAMHRALEMRLGAVDWPRETLLVFDISEQGRGVALDVDLPEIEDLPHQTASVPARGWKVTFKELSQTRLRKPYATHIHGIVFRLAGEVFENLPGVETLTISPYSQRTDKATGKMAYEYLLSVRIPRSMWRRIDFRNLGALSLFDALARFELKREMTATGFFKQFPLSSAMFGGVSKRRGHGVSEHYAWAIPVARSVSSGRTPFEF